jgi:hypothetical protein
MAKLYQIELPTGEAEKYDPSRLKVVDNRLPMAETDRYQSRIELLQSRRAIQVDPAVVLREE